MTTMWPMPAAVAPLPNVSRSTRATLRLASAQAAAQAVPTMPPPAITASKEVMSAADSEFEWIGGTE